MNYDVSISNILKHFSTLLLFVIVTDISAQPKVTPINISANIHSYKVEFDSITSLVDQNLKLVLDESKPGSPVLKSSTVFIKIPPNAKVRASLFDRHIQIQKESLIRVNPRIQRSDSLIVLQSVELNREYFISDFYPATEIEVLDYFWINDEYYSAIKINQFRYNWRESSLWQITMTNLLLEIVSDNKNQLINFKSKNQNGPFTNVLNTNNNNGTESLKTIKKEKEDSDSWIDFSKTYYKFAIYEDGIYRIDYTDLTNYGINSEQLHPESIKIFKKGKQFPIYVKGESDNRFDKTDYIEFYCGKNYDEGNYRNQVQSGEDYINYLDRYTDTSYVWLTLEGEKGERIVEQNSSSIKSTDTITSYIDRIHFEEDKKLIYYDSDQPRTQLPFWQENKVWTWMESWELGSKKSFDFSISQLVPNSNVKTFTRAISSAAPIAQPAGVHNIGISLNNSSNVSHLSFNKNQTITLKSDFNSSLISNGKNQVYIHNIPTGVSPNTFLLDWFEIEYRRFLNAQYNNPRFQNDSISFTINDSIKGLIKSMKIEGVSDNHVIYKISNHPKKIIGLHYSGNNSKYLTFSDTINAGDSFICVKENLIKKPIFLYQRIFKNLKVNKTGADYIIISSSKLKSSCNLYSDYIKGAYDLRTSVYLVEDLYDQFNYGFKNPMAIKEFLFNAYKGWVKPRPKYLFLVGEANYDYKNKWPITPIEKYPDLVPSYGFPVSDTWYVCFDSLGLNIPQMYVGRLPAITNAQVNRYLEKHKNYLLRPFDHFNKNVMLFSGGNPEKIAEMDLLRKTNIEVASLFSSSPIKPKLNHYNKTINPQSNFGPYTFNAVKNSIDSGAVYISYLGHSGTQTWDNGITTVQQLDNIFNGNSFIADFGCSTAKFAEPDIKSFAELFVSDNTGNAIGYIGNSSVGFLSVATTFPQIFGRLLIDSLGLSLGEIQFQSKMQLFQQQGGFIDVNRSFNYCSVLIGDPVIRIKFPPKPNLFVTEKSSINSGIALDDKMEYYKYSFSVGNSGRTVEDSITIKITDFYKGNSVYSQILKTGCPAFLETFECRIPIKNLPGIHTITVVVDPSNLISEINEDDNNLITNCNVNSASLRVLESDNLYATNKSKIAVLNPVKINQPPGKIIFAFDTVSTFVNPILIDVFQDTVYTTLSLPNQKLNKRYWWKSKFVGTDTEWSPVNSYYNSSNKFTWYFAEPLNDIFSKDVAFNQKLQKWTLSQIQNTLRIQSGGLYDGATAVIEYDGKDKVADLLWGMATAILDSISLEPQKVLIFKSGGINLVDSLASYINHLPEGTLIAMAIGTEARNYILSSNTNSVSRHAIKSLGSKYIDQVGYRESWAMIGKKGAMTGSVPEVYKKILEGPAVIDTNFLSFANEGFIHFPSIKNCRQWEGIQIKNTGKVDSYIVGENDAGICDTIAMIDPKGLTSLIKFNSKNIHNANVVSHLIKTAEEPNPSIEFIGIINSPVTELAINYQVVSISKDSLDQGEIANLKFMIYNVGSSTASNFKARIDLVKKDNFKEKIFEQIVDSIKSESKKQFSIGYNTSNVNGAMQFNITIDPDNIITELYEDNNFYSIPFFVKSNNKPASLNLTIDGNDILNGDFISSKPNIKVELNDESLIAINDTNKIQLYLNNNRIYFSNSNKNITYLFSSSNPKMTVNFTPKFKDGDYTLKVIGKNATDQVIDSSGIVRKFSVKNELLLLNVYNYPNPFREDTYFTFKLTQIPDEVRILIFTIAGRKIKEIKLNSSELCYDFNRIFWDGRDADGDYAANGTYLYKIISVKGSEKTEIIQKLSIVH